MRLKLIGCEVMYREMCWAVSRSPNIVDVEFLTKGLHDLGSRPMRDRLQEVVDRVDPSRYDAVVLAYALCNNGLTGLQARELPLVLPRAHDCITMFLGSRHRYTEFFNSNPGVYFKTTGWMERGENTDELSQISIQHKSGMDASLEEMIAKYGEENGRFLYDTLCDHTRNYSQFTFIQMGVEPNESYEADARIDAESRGWRFTKERGDLTLFVHLVDGEWDDNFLIVPPGKQIRPTYDENIVAAAEPEA